MSRLRLKITLAIAVAGGCSSGRPIPDEILAAGNAVVDPDARIVAMLGARSDFAGGNGVATERHAVTGTQRDRSLHV